MWKEGTIGINAFSKDKATVICHYWCKCFEEGSEFGIDGGRISKLTIKANGVTTLNYDRGLDIEPEDEATQMALAILLHDYN